MELLAMLAEAVPVRQANGAAGIYAACQAYGEPTMTTETILTDEQIIEFYSQYRDTAGISFGDIARAIEQAVLQSPEVQRLRRVEAEARILLEILEVSFVPPLHKEGDQSESSLGTAMMRLGAAMEKQP